MTLWLVIGCVLCSGARAESVPPPGERDARVRTVEYHAMEVYRLHGYVGQDIHITVQPGEEVKGLGGGVLEGITWNSESNHLWIKPRVPRLSTHFTILTSRRAYEVHYSASQMSTAKEPADLMYALHFLYPEDVQRRTAAQATAEQLAKTTPTSRNQDYWFCGAKSLKPVAAWDDGTRTVIRFAADTEWPAIFAVGDDDQESLVNYSVEGADIIVHRLAPTFLLRRGRLVGCIQNRGATAHAVRPASGTASPSVERTLRGAP